MNLKKAKRLRRVARIATNDGDLRSSEYEMHRIRGTHRVALTCARSVYKALKKEIK